MIVQQAATPSTPEIGRPFAPDSSQFPRLLSLDSV
jgi:hypothetical protein